jgi:hypothetical protein
MNRRGRLSRPRIDVDSHTEGAEDIDVNTNYDQADVNARQIMAALSGSRDVSIAPKKRYGLSLKGPGERSPSPPSVGEKALPFALPAFKASSLLH